MHPEQAVSSSLCHIARQAKIHSHGQFRVSPLSSRARYWTVGRRRRTRREAAQTQGVTMQTPHRKRPGLGIKPSTFLLWGSANHCITMKNVFGHSICSCDMLLSESVVSLPVEFLEGEAPTTHTLPSASALCRPGQDWMLQQGNSSHPTSRQGQELAFAMFSQTKTIVLGLRQPLTSWSYF